jgi:hypothetical protein
VIQQSPHSKSEKGTSSMPFVNPEVAPADGLLSRALDPLLARLATADPCKEQIEEGLACLSAAEELQLSRLLRKLERHLQTLLAHHDSASPCELS